MKPPDHMQPGKAWGDITIIQWRPRHFHEPRVMTAEETIGVLNVHSRILAERRDTLLPRDRRKILRNILLCHGHLKWLENNGRQKKNPGHASPPPPAHSPDGS